MFLHLLIYLAKRVKAMITAKKRTFSSSAHGFKIKHSRWTCWCGVQVSTYFFAILNASLCVQPDGRHDLNLVVCINTTSAILFHKPNPFLIKDKNLPLLEEKVQPKARHWPLMAFGPRDWLVDRVRRADWSDDRFFWTSASILLSAAISVEIIDVQGWYLIKQASELPNTGHH